MIKCPLRRLGVKVEVDRKNMISNFTVGPYGVGSGNRVLNISYYFLVPLTVESNTFAICYG